MDKNASQVIMKRILRIYTYDLVKSIVTNTAGTVKHGVYLQKEMYNLPSLIIAFIRKMPSEDTAVSVRHTYKQFLLYIRCYGNKSTRAPLLNYLLQTISTHKVI